MKKLLVTLILCLAFVGCGAPREIKQYEANLSKPTFNIICFNDVRWSETICIPIDSITLIAHSTSSEFKNCCILVDSNEGWRRNYIKTDIQTFTHFLKKETN